MTTALCRRTLPGLLLAACLAALPSTAQSSETAQRYVLAASRLYENLEYERALDQLKRARQESGGVEDDVAVALYEGIILFDMGKKEEALAAFREGLYLRPDAKLPVKVSPKISGAFDLVRTDVKAELAPILARKAAEGAAKRKAAEDAAKKLEQEEAQRKVQAERQAEEEARLKAVAETARQQAEAARLRADVEARKRAEAASKRAQEELDRLNNEIAARKQAEVETQRAREEQARLLRELDAQRDDRPEQRTLLARDGATTVPPDFVPDTTKKVERPVPVAPFVFAGVALAAGGVAVYFGNQSQTQVAAARAANFQSDTDRHLQDANGTALIANVAIGVAVSAAVGALISLVVDRPPAPPPPSPGEAP